MKIPIKYLLLAAVIILIMAYILAFSDRQTYYDFPLTKASVENAFEEVNLDWKIVNVDSIDAGNSVFTLSNSEYLQKIDIASMNKDGMLSFSIIPRDSIANESIVFDDTTRKQLLQITCELTGIENYNSIYGEFSKYIEERDSKKYGPTSWYYKAKDKVLEISMIPSSVYLGKYQIRSIKVQNIAFFKESRKMFTNYNTQSFKKQDLPVYTDLPLNDIVSYISEDNESIARIVIVGSLSNIKKSRVGELDVFNLNDSDYSLYSGDYSFAQISDGTDTIKVLLPRYIVDLSLLTEERKEWHISYHPYSDIYLVEYGVDIHSNKT